MTYKNPLIKTDSIIDRTHSDAGESPSSSLAQSTIPLKLEEQISELHLETNFSNTTTATISEYANVSIYDVPTKEMNNLFDKKNFQEFFTAHFKFLTEKSSSDVVNAQNVLEIIGEAALLSKMEEEIIRHLNETKTSKEEFERNCNDMLADFKNSSVYQIYYGKDGLVGKSKEFIQHSIGSEFKGFADTITSDMREIESIKNFDQRIEYIEIIRDKLGLQNNNDSLKLSHLSKNSKSIESLILSIAFSDPQKMGKILAASDFRNKENGYKKSDLIIKAQKSSKSINAKSAGLELFSFCTFIAAGVAIGLTGNLVVLIGAIFASMILQTATNYVVQKIRDKANKKKQDLDSKKFSSESNKTFRDILQTIDKNQENLLKKENIVRDFFLQTGISDKKYDKEDHVNIQKILAKNSNSSDFTENNELSKITAKNNDNDIKISIYDIKDINNIITGLNSKEKCNDFLKNNFKLLDSRADLLQMNYKKASEIIGEAALLFKIKIEIMRHIQDETLRNTTLKALEDSDIYKKYHDGGDNSLINRASKHIKTLGLQGIVDSMAKGMNKNLSLVNVENNIKAMQKNLGMKPGQGNINIDLNSIKNNSSTVKNIELSVLSSSYENIGFLLLATDNRSAHNQQPNELILQAKKSTNIVQKCKDNYPAILFFALIVAVGACIGAATLLGGPIVGGVVGGMFNYLLPKINSYLSQKTNELKSSNPLVETTEVAKDITRVFQLNQQKIKTNKSKIEEFFKETELPSNNNAINVNQLICSRATQPSMIH